MQQERGKNEKGSTINEKLKNKTRRKRKKQEEKKYYKRKNKKEK